MQNLSTILRVLMNEVKITVTELARQTGVGQPVIHRMASGETDNPKVGSLSPIAKFFNVNISQLIGDEPLPTARIAGSHNPYYRSWYQVPMLSWEQAAAKLGQSIPSEVQCNISVESPVSPQAFAIRMEDTTMAPRYPLGTLLLIEPALAVQDKDFVAILIDGEPKIQFKQLLMDGQDIYLKPFNTDFETKRVNQPYEIKGVMIQSLTEYHQERRPRNVEEENLLPEQRSPVKKKREQYAFQDDDI